VTIAVPVDLADAVLSAEIADDLAFANLKIEALERMDAAVVLGQALGTNGHSCHRRDLLVTANLLALHRKPTGLSKQTYWSRFWLTLDDGAKTESGISRARR